MADEMNQGSGKRRRSQAPVLAAVVAVVAAFVGLVFLLGNGDHDEIEHTCGDSRVVVLDLSCQNRSDAAVSRAVEVITRHLAAAVCQDRLTVAAVGGGRQQLLEPTLPFRRDLQAPNPRAGANKAAVHVTETRIVSADLGAAYAAHPSVTTTSLQGAPTCCHGSAEPRRTVGMNGQKEDQGDGT